MTDAAPDLVTHLEAHLGLMTAGWKDDAAPRSGLQVVKFGDAPFTGVSTLVTLGLSHHHLGHAGAGAAHQEFLMHLPNARSNNGPPLLDLARDHLRAGRGLRQGETIEFGKGFLGSPGLVGLWAHSPVYLPDEFATYKLGEKTVRLVWLIPITAAEAALSAAQGWRTLRTAFLEENPDLTDLDRPSVQAALTAPEGHHHGV
ncbi:suppressor of fused domain protein [Amycolatopsis sp. H20-H5]|uniref:suppressor of fused domain protein n=1 Tax=Amycolatopsis sp. H20-H5 TaxID=3046309 RepID=UPI002DBAC768|nr:suppressor of fused domain protein [Amycolatopsis sp. H20-H5]MEC3976069.1 suppressor of fused domain protein [Amycolatopsis sp. H20-H5]